uniref:MobV family relaxase n=1 Tax=Staphylococcus shinii TaxID=2912228 RepID=UPI003F86039D
QNFNNLIEEKIEQNYTGKRKIRTDAVKHIDGLITSDNEFFNNQTSEDTKQFFEHAKEFLEQEYGKDNLLYATVHMDEKTPHMHYGVVPLTTDGRLSAKEVVGNKKALTEFQDRFNEHVKQQGYDLERGQSRQITNAKHEQISQYKQRTEYHKQEYERESQKSAHIKQGNEKMKQEYQKSLETLKKPVNVSHELETEKVGGLFSKEIQETGNVVISQKEFDDFKNQIKAAQNITEDYKLIKSGEALQQANKKYMDKDDELVELGVEHEDLIDDFNDLADKYNKLLKENERKEKAIEESFKFIHNIFKMIKDIVPENVYHKIIDRVDNRIDSPKMRKMMTIDKTDEELFRKKHPKHKAEIRFQKDRDDGFTL